MGLFKCYECGHVQDEDDIICERCGADTDYILIEGHKYPRGSIKRPLSV